MRSLALFEFCYREVFWYIGRLVPARFSPFGVMFHCTAACWVVGGLRGSVPYGSWAGWICGYLGRLLSPSFSPIGIMNGWSVWFVKVLRGSTPWWYFSKGIFWGVGRFSPDPPPFGGVSDWYVFSWVVENLRRFVPYGYFPGISCCGVGRWLPEKFPPSRVMHDLSVIC